VRTRVGPVDADSPVGFPHVGKLGTHTAHPVRTSSTDGRGGTAGLLHSPESAVFRQ
jgi:hypothetical protein